MKGIQLTALSLFNEETGELVNLLYPSRMSVAVAPYHEQLMDGQIVELAKAYVISATGLGEHEQTLASWAEQDVWIVGMSKDEHVLQAYGQVAVKNNRLEFRSDCTAGYNEEGMHNSGMSFCNNALALWKWDSHPGKVFMPFLRDMTVRFKGELVQLDIDGEEIARDRVNGSHTFVPYSNTVFFYIDAPKAKRPVFNLGRHPKQHEEFDA